MLAPLRLLTAACAVLCVAGCSSPEPKGADDPPPAPPRPTVEQPKEPELEQIINVGPASFEKFAEGGKQERLWTVRWKSAVANLFEGGDFAGRMQEVTGSIYQEGAEAATFTAETGTAVKASETLTLAGNVTIRAKKSGISMTCQKIVYEAKTKMIKASGGIRIEGRLGTISGVNELWTTPDLETVATPDLWGQKP
jgi:hypothetical protein